MWVNFGGPCYGRCWYILCPFGLFYGHLILLNPFGIFCGNLAYFYPFWYVVPRKIWQPWGKVEKTAEKNAGIREIVGIEKHSSSLPDSLTKLLFRFSDQKSLFFPLNTLTVVNDSHLMHSVQQQKNVGCCLGST
jgi:hypothetical protein